MKHQTGIEAYYIIKNNQKMRFGYTTGTCAAAAAKAAAQMLLSGEKTDFVVLTTPKGITLNLEVVDCVMAQTFVSCAIVKDAGDDPDVTDGIRIYARVERAETGFHLAGGAGVGRVTRPGLEQAVGEAAINRVPRQMITEALQETAAAYGWQGGLRATISVPEGAERAQKTFNPLLGIEGGISILGTSGIVEPMSEKALVDTICLEMDSLYAAGQRVAFLCPGNYGADFARETLELDLERAVKCSNYIGEAFDHAVVCGYPEILLVGHAGKLVKLAAGVMNTHSSVADARQEIFTAHAALCGAGRETLELLMQAVSVDACIELLDREGVRESVMARIQDEMEKRIARRLKGRAAAEFIMFTTKYGVLAQSAGAARLCEKLRKNL